jgi:hypothetical protein
LKPRDFSNPNRTPWSKFATRMYLVQLLLPLYDNANNKFPRSAFDRVRKELTERFGGVTAFLRSPAEGFWKPNEATVSRDDVVVFEVMAKRLDHAWWARYREELEERFRQEELVVRASAIRRLSRAGENNATAGTGSLQTSPRCIRPKPRPRA